MTILLIIGVLILSVVGYGLCKTMYRRKKYLKSSPFAKGYKPLREDDYQPFDTGSAYDVFIEHRKDR